MDQKLKSTSSDALPGVIRGEILAHGPIPFSRFMELALYEPALGYYRRERDPFGRGGDFFTAEQLQPVFGRLICSAVEKLFEELGYPDDFAVVELGAGRGEMASAFSKFNYVPLEIGQGELPERLRGVVFSNEFFDALPVDLAERSADGWRERRVGLRNGAFEFVSGPVITDQASRYLSRYSVPDQEVVELHFGAIEWLKSIAQRLTDGFVLTIDYGYTKREAIRFAHGSLMSYRRHQASENVLKDPGEQDITSHVPFSMLEDEGTSLGLECVWHGTLSQFLIELGEEKFIESVKGGHELQLKTLLFGMGETFRVLLQRKKRD